MTERGWAWRAVLGSASPSARMFRVREVPNWESGEGRCDEGWGWTAANGVGDRYRFNIARCRPCWGFNKNELANKDWGMVTGRVKGDGTGDAEGEGSQVIFAPPGDGRGGGGRSRGTARSEDDGKGLS